MLKTFSSILSTLFLFAVIIMVVILANLWRLSQSLPDYKQLAKYEPAVTTRLYAGDGQLLKEYATEQRLFMPVNKIPDLVKQAFISAEDKKFYEHSGVDYVGILRAVISNIKNLGSGRRPSGASTITQQVAKNFLLSSELSYVRKIKEAMLAWRMEQAFTKDHILELYLNEIYLGNRSYGVAAAALNYFDKPLSELTLEEIAYLAALPKGPNNYNPRTRYDAAVARRNWVIGRMLEEGYIDEYAAETAKAQPLKVVERDDMFVKHAEYFSEEVRREIEKKFGEEALNEGGLIVRTTVNPKLQEIATRAFRESLQEYDRRHGWRGATANIELKDDYMSVLAKTVLPVGAESSWEKAVVTLVKNDMAEIKTADGAEGVIPLSVLHWAGKTLPNQGISKAPSSVKDVLTAGDVIWVEKVDEAKVKKQKLPQNTYNLRQVPNVDGGLIAIDPHTGRVLAMVGGYSYKRSQFNRVTQAKRQTGSSFKPFVYLCALENGYSPTDLILDAPFVLDQGAGLPKWKPQNFTKKFYGLMTLREGVEKSRNLMTVRLAQEVGMDKISEFTKRVGINDNLPELLSMSLGAGETKLINLTSAYAEIVNGGKKVTPYLIERIQDRYGRTILKQDERACPDCNFSKWEQQQTPKLDDTREQLFDSLSAYQMTSILEGVATRGSGAKLRRLKKHLGGKTGTTNDSKEGWFIGFSPDLVVGTYVGFDEPRSLGRWETGASAALPIFQRFMEEALKDQPDIPFRIPAGIKLVRINYKTGRPAVPGDEVVITEAIKPDFDFEKAGQRIINGKADNDNEVDEHNDFKRFGNSVETDNFQIGAQY